MPFWMKHHEDRGIRQKGHHPLSRDIFTLAYVGNATGKKQEL